jgi:hypothetical protein
LLRSKRRPRAERQHARLVLRGGGERDIIAFPSQLAPEERIDNPIFQELLALRHVVTIDRDTPAVRQSVLDLDIIPVFIAWGIRSNRTNERKVS